MKKNKQVNKSEKQPVVKLWVVMEINGK